MTKERRVLLAADETSLDAATWVARNCAGRDTRVRIVHVTEPTDAECHVAAGHRYPAAVTHRFDSAGAGACPPGDAIKGLADVCRALSSAGVDFDGEVRPQWPHPHVSGRRRRLRLQRDVADEVEDAAADFQADVIVVGASRRGGTLDVGRTAQAVALTSPCTVIIVK